MSIEVVAGTDTPAFAVATLDYRLVQARTRRDHYRAVADQAALDGAPVMESLALARADTISESIDLMLTRRHRLTSEAL